ncbi:MAG: hypothetical protein GTN53_27735, partial [Candidatus Aminicenantes bacterium]|nr:hypothetical protein [Gammaproteobacteria bacterium]NIO84310.1 hypothetical protein [Candidatus Aminicenantes bacterium]NIQ70276.1 hypothetical protein [Candidatus Aminicenantes bacterium]NIT26307.1 hypothetical protein [Candidatus Aminicenantes bacterium]
PDLGNLTNLTILSLYGNQLTGSIPAWLNNLTNLNALVLSSNQLSGGIPDLSNLTQLSQLNLSDNQLTGAIPQEIGNLNALQYLFLHNNQLSGNIPSELGNLTALKQLYLHGNQLVGDLPGTLVDLTGLYSTGLNISWNGLYTYDSNLRDFLNSKSLADWEATQTIAPEGLSSSEESHESVKISWTPIQYQSDPGGYRVYYSTTPGSGYTLAGTTANKSAADYTVTGLNPDTTYYFVVETFTDPHSDNQNTVTSEYSTEISAVTL